MTFLLQDDAFARFEFSFVTIHMNEFFPFLVVEHTFVLISVNISEPVGNLQPLSFRLKILFK